jgi:uncharacterized protein (DUF952 family)
MNIFHIVSTEDWAQAVEAGSYAPESLASEGFVHFSYAEQVAGTANRYYRGLDGLSVLEADPSLLLSEVRVEDTVGSGVAYPHVYGPIPPGAVVAVHRLARDPAGDYVFSPVA